ncbi:prolipoprotein diacylglyceryl transferase [bacterium]|nr:prolipoprotein diacylglyceryl transferase [bacterium]
MLPVLFRIGSLEIPSFGVMLACGIFLAGLYFIKQFPSTQREELVSLLAYCIFAGLIGARVNYMLEHWRDGQVLSMFFSRSGLTVYGGILAGIATAILYCRKHGLPIKKVLDAGALAICIGYAIGRIGCQLAGDGDYGIPSNLPWAMAYPDGTAPVYVPVHPTPVYETILYAILFIALLKWKKRGLADGKLFAIFLILAGLERFWIEFIRLNPVLFWNLTEAQIVSIVLICVGVYEWFSSSRRPDVRKVAAQVALKKT